MRPCSDEILLFAKIKIQITTYVARSRWKLPGEVSIIESAIRNGESMIPQAGECWSRILTQKGWAKNVYEWARYRNAAAGTTQSARGQGILRRVATAAGERSSSCGSGL